ncbi:MAG: dicarboxylate/amino acid:cation symporter [Lachnospiraceae bacterium]|nr:dicarboxylate/amino acid:cation symporter [Lachnospiraceae bacterium]
MKGFFGWYKKHITAAIFTGLVLGILAGLFLAVKFSFVLSATQLLGGIYMNALNMMIFPLVFCSIIMGIANIGNIRTTGKITGYAMLYFLSTTALASFVGIVIPRLIRLGRGVTFEMAESDIQATQMTSILDTIKGLIPSNPVASFANGNMLQVLVFAAIVGFTCISIVDKAEPLLKVIDSVNEVCLKVISIVMYFTPVGVFCTITPVVEANGIETIITLATQLLILYLAFFGFAIIVYGASVKFLGKESPKKFLKAIMPAALNAFGTCSSSATIPISKKCMEDEMGVDNKITSIVIPLGATVNMDAVSILMSFMIMFFANACGVEVSIPMMIVLLLANVLLSVGTPGIPGGAIASFAALATMAGLPAGVMGVYISINTLCDMGATCVNVIGDLACCAVLKEKIKLNKVESK